MLLLNIHISYFSYIGVASASAHVHAHVLVLCSVVTCGHAINLTDVGCTQVENKVMLKNVNFAPLCGSFSFMLLSSSYKSLTILLKIVVLICILF